MKRWGQVALIVGSLAGSMQVAWATELVDRIIARVNDDVITERELDTQMRWMKARLRMSQLTNNPDAAVLRHQVLERLILSKLQLEMAKSTQIKVDDTTIDRMISALAQQDGMTVGDLQAAIEREGMPWQAFRDSVAQEMIISRLQQQEVGSQITVSNSEIEDFLNSVAGQDQSGVEYRLGHILIALPEAPNQSDITQAKQAAQKLYQRLQQGADFTQLAIHESQSPQALDGGDLGWRRLAEIPTLFADRVPPLTVGQVLGPIQSPSGFHIIKLVDKRSGDKRLRQETLVRHILLKPSSQMSENRAKETLQQLRQQILKGQDFAKLAQKHSQEMNTAAKGGDLGWVADDALIPEFAQQVHATPIGQISEPFKTKLGWHLIQIRGRRNQQDSADAAKNKASEVLFQRKFDENLIMWLRKLREEAQIDMVDQAKRTS